MSSYPRRSNLAGRLALAAALAASCAHGSSTPDAVVPSTGPHAPDGQNPFAGASFYINPDYAQTVQAVAGRTPAHAAGLKKLATMPTAVWLDNIEQAKKTSHWLDDAQAQEKTAGGPVVPVFVVYDLPGRDCAAEASNGELDLTPKGEARYQHEYIDTIAAQIKTHPTQRIVLVVEPDSLANLATNLGVEKCAAAEPFYRRSIAYAVSKLSLPNVYLYLDGAHAGWLGWPKNLPKAVKVFQEVLAAAGGPDRIRGFALNVSNYDVLVDSTNPRNSPDDPSPDEMAYVGDLAKALSAAGIKDKGFIIDTGRNGKGGIRTAPGNWCNVKGAGVGERPRVSPAPLLDAYFWIKPPGESDGTADQTAKRFDPNCGSEDATPGAPEAGKLFEPYLVDLVKNAAPPL